MDVTKNDIDIYLSEVKESIRNNRYRIEQNPRRQDNANLFLDYIIDESMAKDILLGLTATDSSEVRHNEHRGFEHELLYIFGKDVKLVYLISLKKLLPLCYRNYFILFREYLMHSTEHRCFPKPVRLGYMDQYTLLYMICSGISNTIRLRMPVSQSLMVLKTTSLLMNT